MIRQLQRSWDIARGERSADGRHVIDKKQMTSRRCPGCGEQVYLNRFGRAFTEHGLVHDCKGKRG
jgi:pyruvate/2-oxoacid:ferredoxin oxidoreductase beta subunit